jgi:carbamoyltransferase
MNILGLSAFYHDSAAALVQDGRIVAAAEEERFSRRKQDSRFPRLAVDYVLREGGISVRDIDVVVFYDQPQLKFRRLLASYLSYGSEGERSFMDAMSLWLGDKLWLERTLRRHLKGYLGPIRATTHHESHAASAFFPSPFQDAAILTVDGVGEWETTTLGEGRDNRIDIHKRIHFPHSLGLLFSAMTYFTGFKVNSGEYKVMGLAPYGEPCHVNTILSELIDLKDDGSFHLNMSYFDFVVGSAMTNERWESLFGRLRRKPESILNQDDMNLARSIQDVVELAMLRLARHAHSETGSRNLCLAGGVALNCVANGKILREGLFDSIWIQPAAGDAGGALGAALYVWHQIENGQRHADCKHDAMQGAYLGPAFTADDIRDFLDAHAIPYDETDKPEQVAAQALANGKVVGWFQGRAEFGPRALGGRSILGDPRRTDMQKTMNLKIKFRESFRPFAPAVLREDVAEWFEMECDSPYMLLVAPVSEGHRRTMTAEVETLFGIDKLNVARSDIPAVTHVDYSARVQTVDGRYNSRFRDLIRNFKAMTGCPVVINTSFNVRGEPMVNSPEDAYRCFMRTGIDVLVLEDFVLQKSSQPEFEEDGNFLSHFALD